ncbi:MAG TPA: transposase [Steroidobacteraceae bacterium]|jgi:putative transposase|nr:transposase [Steroidobacteraceae bacterium]
MKGPRITAQQIVTMLREAEQTSVLDVARKYSVSDAAIYTWRKKFSKLDSAAVDRLREIESRAGRRKKAAQATRLAIIV